jgi:hypothetical protein
VAELESESEIIRAELAEMDTLAGQTEAAIFRLLSNVMSGPSTQVGLDQWANWKLSYNADSLRPSWLSIHRRRCATTFLHQVEHHANRRSLL